MQHAQVILFWLVKQGNYRYTKKKTQKIGPKNIKQKGRGAVLTFGALGWVSSKVIRLAAVLRGPEARDGALGRRCRDKDKKLQYHHTNNHMLFSPSLALNTKKFPNIFFGTANNHVAFNLQQMFPQDSTITLIKSRT